MLLVVTGGSGSGKSAFAEALAVQYGKAGKRYYVATMKAYGEEGSLRVKRHRRQRQGKGFITMEEPVDLKRAALHMDADSVALVECMSNLTANLMFDGEEIPVCGEAAEMVSGVGKREGFPSRRMSLFYRIKEQTEALVSVCKCVIVVTNEVFSDGLLYEEETMRYMELLGMVNRYLMERADAAWEIVYGLAVPLKAGAENTAAERAE